MKKFLVPILCGTILVGIFFGIRFIPADGMSAYQYYIKYHNSNISKGTWTAMLFSDGFAIAGICMACFVGLLYVDRGGTFDTVNYGMKRFLKMITRKKDPDFPKTIYEYKENLAAKPKSPLWPTAIVSASMFIIGVFVNIIFI